MLRMCLFWRSCISQIPGSIHMNMIISDVWWRIYNLTLAWRDRMCSSKYALVKCLKLCANTIFLKCSNQYTACQEIKQPPSKSFVNREPVNIALWNFTELKLRYFDKSLQKFTKFGWKILCCSKDMAVWIKMFDFWSQQCCGSSLMTVNVV